MPINLHNQNCKVITRILIKITFNLPEVFGNKTFNRFVAFNYESQRWKLAASVAYELLAELSEFLLESHRLKSGERSPDPQVQFLTHINSL